MTETKEIEQGREEEQADAFCGLSDRRDSVGWPVPRSKIDLNDLVFEDDEKKFFLSKSRSGLKKGGDKGGRESLESGGKISLTTERGGRIAGEEAGALLEDPEIFFISMTALDLERLEGHLKRFNPIRVMRMEGMEIRHTNILGWLLDPLETHGLGDRFLKSFLAEAMKGDSKKETPTAVDIALADLRDSEVRREKKNIDLFVTSAANAWSFVIENKLHSKQHSNQLKRYIDQARADAADANLAFRCRGIFLTLHEKPVIFAYQHLGARILNLSKH